METECGSLVVVLGRTPRETLTGRGRRPMGRRLTRRSSVTLRRDTVECLGIPLPGRGNGSLPLSFVPLSRGDFRSRTPTTSETPEDPEPSEGPSRRASNFSPRSPGVSTPT